MESSEDAILGVIFLFQAASVWFVYRHRNMLSEYLEAHPYAGIERYELPELKLFGNTYADANAIDDFRFTIAELKILSNKLRIPDTFTSAERDT